MQAIIHKFHKINFLITKMIISFFYRKNVGICRFLKMKTCYYCTLKTNTILFSKLILFLFTKIYCHHYCYIDKQIIIAIKYNMVIFEYKSNNVLFTSNSFKWKFNFKFTVFLLWKNKAIGNALIVVFCYIIRWIYISFFFIISRFTILSELTPY